MCGIAGVMRADGGPPDPAVLADLAAALAHRGPDGRARHVTGGVGMVQTRLAIIDLETGDQPFLRENGSALIANGEIYNHRELRAALGEDRFRSRSDCEPPLALYSDHGEEGLDRLRGMYAIAIHDPARERLVLARDPFGIKPLYWTESAEGLAFASEPQALVSAGLVRRAASAQGLSELLRLQHTTGEETVYEGVRRVLPGQTLVAERGRVVARRRRAALPEGPPVPVREEEALAGLERVLAESVRLHLQSDVGYGLFLSGGIDSSVLLALIARETGRPVRTYTVGFPGTGAHDERGSAAAVAAYCGAEHVPIDFGADDFWTLLPAVAAAVDDPICDYAALPTFKLAGTAAREQKVVLSGEGGDEMFAGYGRYRKAMRPWGGRGGRGPIDRLGVLRPGLGPAGRPASVRPPVRGGGRTRLQLAQARDCADWLPQDLLTKLDRCLMAHGLEGRTPYLDPVLAEFGFRLPDRLKVRGRLGKWLLRRLLDRLVPASVADAFGSKRGFTVPVAEWMRERGGCLAELVARQPGIEELCRPGAVQEVFAGRGRHHGVAAWRLLFLALWHQIHIHGVAWTGSAEDVLAYR